MTDPQYHAELDQGLLMDWCAFCDGRTEFDDFRFSTILMGVFVAGLTPEVDDFLRRFCQSFPPALYANLIRICGNPLPDRDLIPWIRRDLEQKMALFGDEFVTEHDNIQRLLSTNHFTRIEDHSALLATKTDSPIFQANYTLEGDYVIERCVDQRMGALREALYHISINYALAHAIMSPLLNGAID